MKLISLVFLLLLLTQCSQDEQKAKGDFPFADKNPEILQPDPFVMDSKPVLIQGARIMTATGKVYEKANLLMANSRHFNRVMDVRLSRFSALILMCIYSKLKCL